MQRYELLQHPPHLATLLSQFTHLREVVLALVQQQPATKRLVFMSPQDKLLLLQTGTVLQLACMFHQELQAEVELALRATLVK
jgi:hypothetical protein